MFSRCDGTGELHCATVKQQFFRQRGFARVRMGNDGERAPPLNFFCDIHKSAERSTKLIRDKRSLPRTGFQSSKILLLFLRKRS